MHFLVNIFDIVKVTQYHFKTIFRSVLIQTFYPPSGVARGGQGGHGPPKLLLNVFFLQLISGNLEANRKCRKNSRN